MRKKRIEHPRDLGQYEVDKHNFFFDKHTFNGIPPTARESGTG